MKSRSVILILIFIVITVLPLVLGVGYALLYSLGVVGLLSEGITLLHWGKVLMNNEFLESVGYSLYISVASLLLVMTLALFFAWRLYIKPGRPWLYGLLFLPLTFPPLVAGFSWFYILSPGGILSRITHQLGLVQDAAEFPRLVNDLLSIGVLISHVFLIFPLFTLLFLYQVKKERMNALQEMATTLGTTHRQFIRKIFIPVLLKKSAPFLLLYGILIFGAYEIPLLLGRSSPRMISVLITEKMTRFNLLDIPQGYAMATIYCLLVMLVSTFFIKKSNPALW